MPKQRSRRFNDRQTESCSHVRIAFGLGFKQKGNMNKMMHAVVLVVFGGACWFLSMILKLPLMVQPAMARLASVPPGQTVPGLPAFTRLCMAAGPVLLAALGLLALGYCIYVW